jgi:hypothetical protein
VAAAQRRRRRGAPLLAATLKATVEAAAGALRTFRLVFPERFESMRLDRDVEKLVHEHDAVFVPAKA